MTNLAAVLIFSVVTVFLGVILTIAVITGHIDVELPVLLRRYASERRVTRWGLAIEVPLLLLYVGGSQCIEVVFLVWPTSTLPIRLIAGSELIAAFIWLVYVVRLIVSTDKRPQ